MNWILEGTFKWMGCSTRSDAMRCIYTSSFKTINVDIVYSKCLGDLPRKEAS